MTKYLFLNGCSFGHKIDPVHNRWVLIILLILASPAFAGKVRGYRKRNGTMVQGYHRTNPDKTIQNNYGTKGNINPYTGKAGSVTRKRVKKK